jgi:hypothetical protein
MARPIGFSPDQLRELMVAAGQVPWQLRNQFLQHVADELRDCPVDSAMRAATRAILGPPVADEPSAA